MSKGRAQKDGGSSGPAGLVVADVPPLSMGTEFSCPRCKRPLAADGVASERHCDFDGERYRQVNGIWRFLPADRVDYFARFLRDYETIRRREGRVFQQSEYQLLPYVDGKLGWAWRIRAKSFEALVGRERPRLARTFDHVPRVLDLGAGNGWLSNRLAQLGWDVTAVDLLTNDWDGLGAHVHYATSFLPIQAEFDHLPLRDARFDLVIFNASLHYCASYSKTLKEALRVLAPGGRLVVMDSPVYRSIGSGQKMVEAQKSRFVSEHGFASDSIPMQHYLTYEQLEELARVRGIQWDFDEPFYSWRWSLRPLVAKLRFSREPARFMLITGTRR